MQSFYPQILEAFIKNINIVIFSCHIQKGYDIPLSNAETEAERNFQEYQTSLDFQLYFWENIGQIQRDLTMQFS